MRPGKTSAQALAFTYGIWYSKRQVLFRKLLPGDDGEKYALGNPQGGKAAD